ncbi:MAG: hypothetical protein JO297_03860 [Nitrososphaeraceae archaeon]|nr:hypothetical protein [Nitrososphaeraceae archaeon]
MSSNSLIYSNKLAFVVIFIIICALVIDTSIIKVYYLNVQQPSSSSISNVIVFIIISAIYMVGQYYVLGYVNKKSSEIGDYNKKLHIKVLHKALTIVQYGLTAINIFVIVQMYTISRYNVASLIAVCTISYGLSIVLMVILAQRFFSWFRSNRNHVVLLYGLSSAVIGINAVFSLFYVAYMLFLNQPTFIRPHLGFFTPFFIPTPLTVTLNSGYVASSIASFIISWAATAVLLRHYSRKLGAIRYWIIVCLPLIYFLLQFQPLFLNLFLPLSQSQPILFSTLYTLIFTMSEVVGGILFGIAFWLIAKDIRHSTTVRNYMIMSAFGFVLLFVSNQAIVLISAPYPPFGLPTASLMGLSSYLILIGIYSSAVSISQDINLRKSIRKATQQQSQLLSDIGIAQMQKELEKRVMKIVKEDSDAMIKETGIMPSMSEVDVKEYLDNVLAAIETYKKER